MPAAYGAAGSLVAVLLWLYFSAERFLFGAEFTRVYSEVVGHGLNECERRDLARARCERQALLGRATLEEGSATEPKHSANPSSSDSVLVRVSRVPSSGHDAQTLRRTAEACTGA
jgi:hypothetical protein